ncbi:hypothetical protein DY000_02046454 [Brassica cretica]|uniref:Uncharacterized protein n=1 Tax=Brassica cretica TaxID=69181 RepID=A0ABQ7F9Z5_BRACR|nr:hypothetical protein DY000_02046454 [Brassica cretica]
MPCCMPPLHARRHHHVHIALSMSGVHASRHTDLCMSVRMRRSQVLRHLVLLCVELHGTASCTSTTPSCVDTQKVKWLTPRHDPLDQATSNFSVDLRDFGPSGNPKSADNCIRNLSTTKGISTFLVIQKFQLIDIKTLNLDNIIWRRERDLTCEDGEAAESEDEEVAEKENRFRDLFL